MLDSDTHRPALRSNGIRCLDCQPVSASPSPGVSGRPTLGNGVPLPRHPSSTIFRAVASEGLDVTYKFSCKVDPASVVERREVFYLDDPEL